jgi:hypothetical protein
MDIPPVKKKIPTLKKKTPTIEKVADVKPANPAKHMCIEVKNLRSLKPPFDNLKVWLDHPDNQYVGRRGRIFITDPNTKATDIFHYKDTKWGNPYKVAKKGEAPSPNLVDPTKRTYTLSEALRLYREHLDSSGLINDISELKGKNLGCYCKQNSPCHAKLLAELANNI